MEKERFMLIHNDKKIHRFKTLADAKVFGVCCCRGSYHYYTIIDTEKDEVIYKWID